jgi:beta-glucosidase/6-phospho-beta-glucosidase/beta-galactosidase
MKVYSFSEQSYPDAWFEDAESLRVSLPNQHCDPEVAARLYNRYLDEWMLADELGLNIIVRPRARGSSGWARPLRTATTRCAWRRKCRSSM